MSPLAEPGRNASFSFRPFTAQQQHRGYLATEDRNHREDGPPLFIQTLNKCLRYFSKGTIQIYEINFTNQFVTLLRYVLIRNVTNVHGKYLPSRYFAAGTYMVPYNAIVT